MIGLNKNTDALIVVDVQYDFLPGGTVPVPQGDKVIPIINSLIPVFDKIYTTQDWHPLDHTSFKIRGGTWPQHCVQNSHGAQIHKGLKVENATHILKGNARDQEAYSGFEGTNLARRLRQDDITRVFIAGLATDYCVKNTVLDALKNNFKTYVIIDAIRGVDINPGDSENAVEEMKKAGATPVESEEIKQLINQ
jgi:nicotinamidase/pyrazinamidase